MAMWIVPCRSQRRPSCDPSEPGRQKCGRQWGCVMPVILIIAAILAITPDQCRAACVDYKDFLHPAGIAATPVGQRYVAASGTHAYVTDVERGFCVIDVADPHNPRLVGSLEAPRYLWDVAATGSHAYVTTFDGGVLYAIDVSNPEIPRIVASLSMPGMTCGIEVSGAHAYVAGGDLYAVAISDPVHPQIVGTLEVPGNAVAVAVSGDHAYIADLSGRLLIADVSDPAHPLLIGSLDTPRPIWVVAVSEGLACLGEYVDGGPGGLCIVDVSDPCHPTLLGVLDSLGTVFSACVSQGLACASTYDRGLVVVDLTEPAIPTVIDSFAFPYYWAGGLAIPPAPSSSQQVVYLAGGIAYDPLGSSGHFHAIEISPRPHPTPHASLRLPCCGCDAAAIGSHVCIAGGYSGLQIVDVADPQNPTIEGSVDTPDCALAVAVSKGHAFIADNHSGLQVVDIRDPQHPQIVGSVDTEGAGAVAVSGKYAYIADGTFGIRVCDVSNPSDPRIVGCADTPDFAEDVAIAGTFAFVADWRSGLQVVDVSIPDAPQIVGALDLPAYSEAIAVSGRYVYLVTNWPDLQFYVIDVLDPRNPGVVGRTSILDWGSLAVAGRYVYLANLAMGVQIFDASDPENPRSAGFVGTGNAMWGLEVSDLYLFALDHYGCHNQVSTLWIYPSQCAPTVSPRTPEVMSAGPAVRAFPNPARGQTSIRLSMPRPDRIRASVWDVAGRLVRTLYEGDLPAGTRDLHWDGLDNGGKPVSAGVYWVRVKSIDGTSARRLVVLP